MSENLLPAHTISSPMNFLYFDNQAVDTEYVILENIYDSAERELPLRQRELAQIAGASLGMTNSILKRLAQKGWITIKKLNSRNIQYAVTLNGINEIIHRSYRYFKRTIRNAVYYKDVLEDLVYRAKLGNISKVVLVGSSDLDFIVEHACGRWGLEFLNISGDETARGSPLPEALNIYAESIPEASDGTVRPLLSGARENQGTVRTSPSNIFFLSRLIRKQAGAGLNGH